MPTLYAIACLNGQTISRMYPDVPKPYLRYFISRTTPEDKGPGVLFDPSQEYRGALVQEGAFNISLRYDEPFTTQEYLDLALKGCQILNFSGGGVSQGVGLVTMYAAFCDANRQIQYRSWPNNAIDNTGNVFLAGNTLFDVWIKYYTQLLEKEGATSIFVSPSEEAVSRQFIKCDKNRISTGENPKGPGGQGGGIIIGVPDIPPIFEIPRDPRIIESEQSPQTPQNPDTFFGVSSFSGASSNISEGVNFSIDNRFQATDGLTGPSTGGDTSTGGGTGPGTVPQNISLYIAYCDRSELKFSTRSISIVSEDDKKRQRESLQRELQTQYTGVYVDFAPPLEFPTCQTGNLDTLYVIYCDRGSPISTRTTITSNSLEDRAKKQLDYENTLRGLGFTVPETSFTPFNRSASCGSTSPTDNLAKVKEVILKYCDNGNIIKVSKIIAYNNENDFNTKLIQYKQELIGQNGILTSVRLSISDPRVSIDIDKDPLDPKCGNPKTSKVYVTFCQSNNSIGRFEAEIAVDNSKPYSVFLDSINLVIKEQVTDKGGKNPKYNVGSYPPDPVCGSPGGGGGGSIYSKDGTLRIQVQFEENGRILNAKSFSTPIVTVSNDKTRVSVPSFTDVTLSQLGPLASSYTYEIANKDYFSKSTSVNTLTFSPVPGWDTPRQFTFTINKAEDNYPLGDREFGNYLLIRYTRITDTPGPSGPGPSGPEPSGPDVSGPDGPGPSGPGPSGPTPPPPPPTTTTTFRPTTTTTTRFIPIASWLKQINQIDNRRYVFDVTEGLFSNNVRNLITFFTGSTSENYSRYYTHVYDENPKTSLTSSIQFSIAYGHSGGSGSLDEGNKINITPTRAIYSQYRNLVLGRPDVKFNLTGRDTDSIYVVNYQSKRLKDRLDAGVLELNIAHLSGSQFLAGGGTIATHTGSNVKLAGNNRVLRLIDDSKININPDYTDVGYSYNIVSGTLETGVYNKSKPHYYGKLIPSLGIVILDGNKLDLSASFATSKASEIEGYNAIKLYKSFSGSALVQDNSADYLGMKARRVIREYNDYYFIRINNREFNFTNNNSYFIYNKKEKIGKPGDLAMPLDPTSPEGIELEKRLTQTNGEIYKNFVNNPQVYITTVGLYNAQRELVAVGKLAKPILKNFTEESMFTVKLKY
jgi:hypothetical protein